MLSEAQFKGFAEQGYTRVPLALTLLADLDTPLSVYLKLTNNQAFSYLLESVQGGEKWGRYSFIGLPCEKIIRVYGQTIEIHQHNTLVERFDVDNPLDWLAAFHQQYQALDLPDLPRFTGGLVGYFSYDSVRYVESRLADCLNTNPLETPDILLMVSDVLAVYDNLSGNITFIVNADPRQANAYQQAQQKLQQMRQALCQSLTTPQVKASHQHTKESDFESNFSKADYADCVEKIKRYIIDGDCMQVVFSQRLQIPFAHQPLDLYRAIRTINPSPYLYYINLTDFHIVGASPEILVRVENGEISLRPIAGTRPRGKTTNEDIALEQELLADPKELAEHLMLIDLGRNDVGRFSKTGSVEVTEKMIVERYSHVMHIVSNVEGQLKSGLSALDALAASLPAGTLSGAPKIRAMEIIDECETLKRGIYGGAVGYWSWQDNLDMAIAIRTAVIKDGVLYNQVGGGIVADSVIESEWQETMNKGRAIVKAINKIEQGF